MPKYSIITCVSKPDIYQSCLLDSISACRGRHDIEIIPIINHNNVYSASNALNIGIQASKSDILILAHQDIKLLGDWFGILSEIIDTLDKNWAIVGSAGIALRYNRGDIGVWGGSINLNTVAVGSVWDNDNNLHLPPYWDGTKDTCQVHCVDECVFVLNKKSKLRFDKRFNGFHFYGVDMCLNARNKGMTVYGAHLPIVHFGQYSTSFATDRKYWVYYRMLYNKWFKQFPELLGTHMHWAHDELTSYISVGLEDDMGTSVKIKAMGIKKISILNDPLEKVQ